MSLPNHILFFAAKIILAGLTAMSLLASFELKGSTIIAIQEDGQFYIGINEDGNNPSPRYHIIPSNDSTTYGRIIFTYDNNWAHGGMNEKGLIFDWISTDDDKSQWKRDPAKEDYKGNLSQKILAQCATIEEALDIYKEYNEPSFAKALMVLIDSTGQSAFISWKNGTMEINNCQGICMAGIGAQMAINKQKEIQQPLSKDLMVHLLDAGHQNGKYPTLYSNIYDLKRGLIYIYYYHNYDEEIQLNLNELLKKGRKTLDFKEVFKTQIPKEEMNSLQNEFYLSEIKTIPMKGWIALSMILLGSIIVTLMMYLAFRKATKHS